MCQKCIYGTRHPLKIRDLVSSKNSMRNWMLMEKTKTKVYKRKAYGRGMALFSMLGKRLLLCEHSGVRNVISHGLMEI